MLILTRRSNETICLPELGIENRVLQQRGQNVSLGIEAPRQVKILQGELLEEESGESNSFFQFHAIHRSA
ncbi:carbon storage regulator [Bythopirellula polymerisocia]|uniref:Carbon storage regulator n=1 Tax=Bythopirellula polymerisocia TaxID=2528003 RepID=A0A5C6CVI5_9BACT|nr:carbon storage regulator [Bythopirellula polymerisocia]